MKTFSWWLKTFNLRGGMLPSALVSLLLADYRDLEQKLAEAEAKLKEQK